MSFVTCIIPMIIAGIIFRIICKTAAIRSNTLFVISILAIAVFFIVSDLSMEDSTLSLSFAAVIAYNIFKLRTDTEDAEIIAKEGEQP